VDEFNWHLRILSLHKDKVLIDHAGHNARYVLSGRGGWDLYLNGKKYLEDIDGLELCHQLNAAQVEPIQ